MFSGRQSDDVADVDDVDLMQRIVSNDQRALATLYDRYGNIVYGLAYRVLQNPGRAEEVTQDTFMKVWKQADSWDSEKGKLSSWLLTITRYTAIDLIRKENRNVTQVSVPIEILSNIQGNPSTINDPRWHDGRLLRNLMTELPTEQAELIEMAFFQGYTHSQLAENLELPLGTVKTRLRLGLQKLRTLWTEATHEPMQNE
jgi:RNA polymerase sigma-70 factor (ECF subfamily)